MEPLGVLLAGVLGACAGSFVNVVADRLPLGASLLSPRSRCDVCRAPIRARDLIPALSYLLLRGRCRVCGAPIPRRVPIVEALVAALFAAAYLRMGWGAPFAVVSVSASLLAAIAVIDREHGIVPDALTLPGAVVFAAAAPFWSELGFERELFFEERHLSALASGGIGALAGVAALGAVKGVYPAGMGAGDVKLAGLMGLMLGFPGVALALWLAFAAGGLAAVGLLSIGRRGRKDAMPFAPYLAAGGVAAMLAGEPAASAIWGWLW